MEHKYLSLSLLKKVPSLSRDERLVVLPQVAQIIYLSLEFGGRDSTRTNKSVSEEHAGGLVE